MCGMFTQLKQLARQIPGEQKAGLARLREKVSVCGFLLLYIVFAFGGGSGGTLLYSVTCCITL